MATKQSPLLTGLATQIVAATPTNVANDGGRIRSKSGIVVLATGDMDANDIVMLAGVPTGAVVTKLLIANDDLEGATPVSTFNVGIYKEPDDTAENGDENVYATLVTQFQAASGFVDLAFEARGIELNGQKVFEDAGDADDPDGTYYIGVQFVTTPTNKVAGDIAFLIEFVID